MTIAKIKLDGSVISTFKPRAVNVGDGDDMVQYPKGIFVGASQWTDAELNALGFARFYEQRVGPLQRSTGHTDTFEDGIVTRVHTLIDYVAPVVPDKTPADPDYDHVEERRRAYPSQEEIIVALWEASVEGRPEAQDALEIKRQAVKTRFPKA